MKCNKIKRYFIIIGIALFIYLLIKLNIVDIFNQIKSANLYYISIALVFICIYLIFQTLKWFVIAREQKVEMPFIDAFKINMISSFYGLVTPGKVGSVTRATYFGDYKGGTGKGFSNFVIDKILDLSSLFFLAVGFGFLFYNNIKVLSTAFLYVFIAIFVLIVCVSIMLYKKELSRHLLRVIYRLIPERLKERARLSFDSFYENIPGLGFLSLVFILNLATWVITYAIFYFVGLSLGVNLSFTYYLAILPISTLVAQIPITISGLGIRELTMISLFGLFNVEAVKVFSMSLITIVLSGVIPSIIAIFLTIKKDYKKK